MLWYLKHLKDLKNFKYWGKGLKRTYIADLIRNGLFMLLGVILYLCLNNTGLLIYLILMIKYHWLSQDEMTK